MPRDGRRNHTFIVRVWCESTDPGDAEEPWRGEVVHLPSGKRAYFGDFDSMAGILDSMTRGNRLS